MTPLLLSRIQFAFVVSFHIIFPSFTIGLAAWLATVEGMRLATGDPVYRRVFDFWLQVFALSFAMGVVSGIVMAFQFGTNWSALSRAHRARSEGPCSATRALPPSCWRRRFFGIMLLGRDRVPPWVLFLVVLNRGARDDALPVFDSLQQQLDAGPAWVTPSLTGR